MATEGEKLTQLAFSTLSPLDQVSHVFLHPEDYEMLTSHVLKAAFDAPLAMMIVRYRSQGRVPFHAAVGDSSTALGERTIGVDESGVAYTSYRRTVRIGEQERLLTDTQSLVDSWTSSPRVVRVHREFEDGTESMDLEYYSGSSGYKNDRVVWRRGHLKIRFDDRHSVFKPERWRRI